MRVRTSLYLALALVFPGPDLLPLYAALRRKIKSGQPHYIYTRGSSLNPHAGRFRSGVGLSVISVSFPHMTFRIRRRQRQDPDGATPELHEYGAHLSL